MVGGQTRELCNNSRANACGSIVPQHRLTTNLRPLPVCIGNNESLCKGGQTRELCNNSRSNSRGSISQAPALRPLPGSTVLRPRYASAAQPLPGFGQIRAVL